MKNIIILFSALLAFSSWSQMSDSFDDGDFTQNPTWTGNESDFIVNANLELQLNAAGAGESYLSTPHNLVELEEKEWRMKVAYGFAPSNNNYGLTYLTAESADLSTSPDGVFLRKGENGANDPIRLIERVGGVETEILVSTPAVVAESFNIRIKVVYRANGDWELYYDASGGENYVLNATANHPTTVGGTHLGIFLKYTASNVTKFKYDDFFAGDIYVDVTPPVVDTVFATTITQVDVLFNEAIDPVSGVQASNYAINNGIGIPLTVEQDINNQALFHLTLNSDLTVGETYTITIQNVEDLAGNSVELTNKNFIYIEAQEPELGDIIINEFIPKPSPAVGLPEHQFVELYNRSDKYFNLNGWKLRDNNSAGTISEVWLFPNEYVVLVPTSGLEGYPNATKVSSWATLNQTGDEIHLETASGLVVDELTYTDAWYKDAEKKDGGWSIERINPDLTCSDIDNWKASTDLTGGTPGAQNSVYNDAPDIISPTVLNVAIELPNQLTLTFSESLDSLSLINAYFESEPSLTIDNRIVNGKYPKKMTLIFEEDFEEGVVYSYRLENFTDCSGNFGVYDGEFMLPQTPEKGDLIINEILFNPLTGGSDFVEIYNTSDKYIDLLNWELANYKDDTIANNKKVNYSYVIRPKDYVVITKDTSFQLMNYPMAVPGKFIQLSTLPSYNNDSSTVLLIYNDTVMDQVSYTEKWHFSLLSSMKGVSLERFSAKGASNDASNWHSASETIGFATPGARNSQNMTPNNDGGTLSLSSKTFSPDGDGYEDVLLISYEVTSPDLIGTITVYDDKGRAITTLMERELLGGKGTVKWEGTKDNGKKAPIGPYIILFEIFDLNNAKVQTVRKVATLAGKF